jgi:hypothetical protein
MSWFFLGVSIIQLCLEDLPELGLDLWFLGQTNFHFAPGELEIFITTLVLTLMSVTRAIFEIRFSCTNLHRIPQVLDDNKTPLQENRWLNWLWFISRQKTPWQRLEKKQKKEDVNKLVEYCHYTSVVILEDKNLNSLRFDKWIGLRSLSLDECKMEIGLPKKPQIKPKFWKVFQTQLNDRHP